MDTTALNLALDQLAAAAAETDRHAVGVQSGAAKALSNATQTRHDVVDVLAALADVRAALAAPDPTPPPAARRTLFGANPYNSGRRPTTADILTVTGRYAPGAAVRLFDGTGTLNPAPVEPGAALIHASWKTDMAAVTSGSLDALIGVAIAALRSGDSAEAIHEADVKGLDPAATLLFRRAWVRAVKATRPDVDVPFTIGGWRFDPDDKKGGPDPWVDCVLACDLLGVDLDGTPAKALPYYDYRPIVDKIVAWMDTHGIPRWAVPELAVKRAPDDPTGEHRAAWIKVQTDHMLDLGDRAPERVCLFESRATDFLGTELTAQVEQDAWRALI